MKVQLIHWKDDPNANEVLDQKKKILIISNVNVETMNMEEAMDRAREMQLSDDDIHFRILDMKGKLVDLYGIWWPGQWQINESGSRVLGSKVEMEKLVGTLDQPNCEPSIQQI